MTTRIRAETDTFQYPFRHGKAQAAGRALPYGNGESAGEPVAIGWKYWLASDATELKLTVLVVGGMASAWLLT